MGDQAGKVSDASRATRVECKLPNCRGERAVASLVYEKPSCPSAGKAQVREAAARRRSRRRRLLGASAGARLLRFLAARPQTRLEAAAQRPGTPSARCKLHATPQAFSKWQKRWGPTHHSKLQPQEARTGGLGRGSAAPCSDGLAFSLRSWWQQTDHTQRRREALSLACHSWRRDQKLLAHGPPMQGCKHQPAVAVTGRSDCQIH